jgi:nucleotide-binding universal stress UspA family protein
VFKRILVPLDGSRFSISALPYTIDIAKRFRAHIVLLQVVQEILPIAMAAPSGGGPAIKEMFLKESRQQDKKTLTRSRRYLSRKIRELAAQGIKGSYCIMVGEPATSINECCQKEDIDLVVMTTHGRGGFKRTILGSVTDEIIRGSTVPILVIKPQRRRKS